MGVPGPQLPQWKDVQVLTAQLHNQPLPEESTVETELIIGPNDCLFSLSSFNAAILCSNPSQLPCCLRTLNCLFV